MEEVVIIGSGWSGLAAAVHLRQNGFDPLVLERDDTPGGATSTCVDGDWLLEAGPHGFDPAAPPMQRLLDGLRDGMGPLVTAPRDADRFVLHRGRRVPLPRSPTRLASTPLLSWPAKLRLLAEPLAPRRQLDDETVSDFLQRRFGRGLDPIVDAMVTGIFAGDPQRLSAALAFPRLVAAEAEHGSVLRGMMRSDRSARGPLTAPRSGMGPWLAQIASSLRVTYDSPALELDRAAGHWQITCPHDIVEARRVVLAMPPGPTAELLDVPAPHVAAAPVVSVGLGWRDAGPLASRFSGYGILQPEPEQRFSLGVLYESSLFPARAPEGGVLVRALVGGRRHPERARLSDEEIVTHVLEDLQGTHGAVAEPDWTRVLRPPPIPQLEQRHVERLAALEAHLAASPDVEAAGWGWRSVGITDSVAAGQRAAQRVCHTTADAP